MSSEALLLLRGVDGVVGSFACDDEGRLLASDMPAPYAPALLELAAAGLATLLQTGDEALPRCRSVSLAFAEHLLVVRRSAFGLLCVLTTLGADRARLRRVVRLASLRFGARA